jgi:hypothetical protein
MSLDAVRTRNQEIAVEPQRGLISPQLFPFYWLTMCATLGLIFTILA